MTDKDIYTLFTGAIDVTNRSLKKNRDTAFYGTLLSAFDKHLDGHKAGVAIYDEDPGNPFDYFTVRYAKGMFQIQSRGKSEHDTEWKVSKDYLQSLVDNPKKYIEHPTMLDIDWLKSRLPDSVMSMLKKAS